MQHAIMQAAMQHAIMQHARQGMCACARARQGIYIIHVARRRPDADLPTLVGPTLAPRLMPASRSLLASRARLGHLATSKGTSWARARLATRDFLARPAGGPHDLSANGAPRSGTQSGARVAAAAQVLGMGNVRAISPSNARRWPL